MKAAVLIVVLLCLAPLSPFAEESNGGISGEVRYNAFVNVSPESSTPTLEKNGVSGSVRLERALSDAARVYLELRGDIDSTALDTSSTLPGRLSLTLFPGENYISFSAARFLDFELGNRLVFWGKIDNLSPLDILCPYDYTYLTSDPLIEQRIPVAVGRVKLFVGSVLIDFVTVPLFVPTKLPNVLSSIPSSVTFVSPTLPALEPRSFDYALRVSTSVEGWDLGIIGYYGYNDIPQTSFSASPGPVITQSYYQYGLLGAQVEKTFSSFDFKVEYAYSFLPDTGDSDIFSPNPVHDVCLSVAWTGITDLTLELQFEDRVVANFDEQKQDDALRALLPSAMTGRDIMLTNIRKVLADKPYRALSAIVRYSACDGYLIPQGAVICNLPDLDYYLNIMVTVKVIDSLHLLLGCLVFAGPEYSKYGKLDYQSKIFAIVKAYF